MDAMKYCARLHVALEQCQQTDIMQQVLKIGLPGF